MVEEWLVAEVVLMIDCIMFSTGCRLVVTSFKPSYRFLKFCCLCFSFIQFMQSLFLLCCFFLLLMIRISTEIKPFVIIWVHSS